MKRSDMMLVKEAACCRMNCRGVAETYNVIIDDDWALAKEEETDNNNDIGNDDDIKN